MLRKSTSAAKIYGYKGVQSNTLLFAPFEGSAGEVLKFLQTNPQSKQISSGQTASIICDGCLKPVSSCECFSSSETDEEETLKVPEHKPTKSIKERIHNLFSQGEAYKAVALLVREIEDETSDIDKASLLNMGADVLEHLSVHYKHETRLINDLKESLYNNAEFQEPSFGQNAGFHMLSKAA